MKNNRQQSGFSIVELLFICLIVGVLATVTIFNATVARQSYNLQIAADGLQQQLNRCRQEAVRVNNRVSIKVEAQRTIINLNRDMDFDDVEDLIGRISEAAAVTVFNPNNGIVEFTSRGEMPLGATGSFTVTLQGRSRVVSIDPRGSISVGPET